MSTWVIEDRVEVWPHLGQNPSIARTPDGDLLMLRQNLTDCMAGSKLFLHRSADGGRSWSAPETVFESHQELGGVEGPISCLDGLAFIAYEEGVDLKKKPLNPRSAHLVRSEDSGSSWSDPIPLAGPWGTIVPYGKVIRLRSTGELLLPAYGVRSSQDAGDPNRVYLLTSADEGKTWAQKGIIERDSSITAGAPSETDVVELQDDRLLAISRADPTFGDQHTPGFFSHSSDGGATWARMRHTNVIICEPRLIHSYDGRLLLAARSWPTGLHTVPAVTEGGRPGARYESEELGPVPDVGAFLLATDDDGETWTPLLQVEDPRGSAPSVEHDLALRHTYQAGYPDIVGTGDSGYAMVFRQGDPRMPDARPGIPGSEERTFWVERRQHLFQRYVAVNLVRAALQPRGQ